MGSQWTFMCIKGTGDSSSSYSGTQTFYRAYTSDTSMSDLGSADRVISGTTSNQISYSGQGFGYLHAYYAYNRHLTTDEMLSLKDDTAMTHAVCDSFCTSNSYRYFAIADGKRCYCDDSYGTHGTTSGCSTSCAGGGSNCGGGTTTISVYDTKAIQRFTLTNNKISASSVVVASVVEQCASSHVQVLSIVPGSGSASIMVYLLDQATSCTGTYKIGFVVINS